MFAMMSLNELYRNYLLELQKICAPGEAANITAIIFEKFAGLTKADVIKNPSLLLDEKLIRELTERLDELLQHKPVQYITGEAWFCNMKLKVSDAVLIPRPETEELVMAATDLARDQSAILDIGTGSGCIAIALKKKIPAAVVTAVDVSAEALAIAKENAGGQDAAVDFLQMDFLDEGCWTSLKTFDVIISNPPYIPADEKEKLDKNVTAYEPHTALFVPDNEPLLFYKKICGFGKTHLNKGGRIFLECHEDFAKDVAAHFQNEGYEAVMKEDMFGKERMVVAGFSE